MSPLRSSAANRPSEMRVAMDRVFIAPRNLRRPSSWSGIGQLSFPHSVSGGIYTDAMDAELESQFLEHSVAKLEQYCSRIETCLKMLNEDQVWARGGENENAVGNLVLHLCGNVRQWIICGVGGRPDSRDREREFRTRGGVPAGELMDRLQA